MLWIRCMRMQRWCASQRANSQGERGAYDTIIAAQEPVHRQADGLLSPLYRPTTLIATSAHSQSRCGW